MDSRRALSAWLERCTFPSAGSSFRCGVSGGADSLALMALAVAADRDVTAVHVDHGQRGGGTAEAELVAGYAAAIGASFEAATVTVEPGSNLEARMRAARYVVLGPDAATGHTADDQAETLLLSLLRGAGTTGLTAMRPGPSKPLLALRRAETHHLCAELHLDVATDSTNADPRFRRNRVRNEVLALLDDVADRDVVPLLTRTSTLLRDDDTLLDELAAAIDPTDARAVARSPQPLARRALRRWVIDTITHETPDGDRHPPDLATIDRIMAVARGDAVGCDVTGGWRVERSQQRLRLFSTLASSS
jgi:tRNA(Ile)-lysidine synthase